MWPPPGKGKPHVYFPISGQLLHTGENSQEYPKDVWKLPIVSFVAEIDLQIGGILHFRVRTPISSEPSRLPEFHCKLSAQYLANAISGLLSESIESLVRGPDNNHGHFHSFHIELLFLLLQIPHRIPKFDVQSGTYRSFLISIKTYFRNFKVRTRQSRVSPTRNAP